MWPFTEGRMPAGNDAETAQLLELEPEAWASTTKGLASGTDPVWHSRMQDTGAGKA